MPRTTNSRLCDSLPLTFEQALSKASRMLCSRDLTRAQLERKLFGLTTESVVLQVALTLESNGLLNDLAYARKFIDCQLRKGFGRYAIKRKLALNGISPELFEQAWEAEAPDEEASRLRVAEQYAARYGTDRTGRGKTLQALTRRGFGIGDLNLDMDDL